MATVGLGMHGGGDQYLCWCIMMGIFPCKDVIHSTLLAQWKGPEVGDFNSNIASVFSANRMLGLGLWGWGWGWMGKEGGRVEESPWCRGWYVGLEIERSPAQIQPTMGNAGQW